MKEQGKKKECQKIRESRRDFYEEKKKRAAKESKAGERARGIAEYGADAAF